MSRFGIICAGLMLSLAAVAFCGLSDADEAGDTLGKKAASADAQEAKPEAPKPPVFPEDGTPEQYLAFMDAVKKYRPAVKSWSEAREAMKPFHEDAVKAADKVMAAEGVSDEIYEKAVLGKVAALTALAQDDFAASEALLAMPEEVRKSGREALATKLDEDMLLMQLHIAAVQGKEPLLKILDKVDAMLERKGTKLDITDMMVMSRAGMVAQGVLGPEKAMELYEKYIEKASAADNENLVRQVSGLKNSLRALKLPGTELNFTAKLLDGTEFDAASLKGKVVLVDFWATWCGPCVAEIPNVKKAYAAYHAKGFEVVGISLDHDMDKLTKFLEEKEIPWLGVHNDTTLMDGMKMTDYCGVTGIPTMILLDKDGKILSISARGAALEKLLKEQLGEPEVATE